jgi:hypothetical protein
MDLDLRDVTCVSEELKKKKIDEMNWWLLLNRTKNCTEWNITLTLYLFHEPEALPWQRLGCSNLRMLLQEMEEESMEKFLSETLLRRHHHLQARELLKEETGVFYE